ncbi:hypothetical protein F3Y22_tig00002847pilonHSYRG00158 [Hibiscus syriacus]|uniref:Uncharacterized protein n=1 Tax=Hibiscus syriacus TaxID=106335 RepID=A0A6A3CNB3_HIBSY|nr:hypothetical protein F3Y22_tig00002847pilonHSYRG00158 [Hibiscus syriacus]
MESKEMSQPLAARAIKPISPSLTHSKMLHQHPDTLARCVFVAAVRFLRIDVVRRHRSPSRHIFRFTQQPRNERPPASALEVEVGCGAEPGELEHVRHVLHRQPLTHSPGAPLLQLWHQINVR